MPEESQPIFKEELVGAAEAQIVEQSKRIDFYLTEYSIELLVNKLNAEDFVVPAYQREFTWEDDRKSRFIESVVMGLPIPFLFFWENPETGTLEIVDGSQRLRTLQEFLGNNFVLGPLDQLSLLEGLAFDDLPESRQRKIKNRSIRGIVLNEHADEQARFDLFERINTGSKVANKAEVRRGALGGPFLDMIISLAQEPSFIDLAPLSQKLADERVREELVTRFFAYGDGLENYKDKVSPFIFAYTKTMNGAFESDESLRESYENRFRLTMTFIERNFPWGFRRALRGTTTPRSRFEAISIGSYLALKERPDLAEKTIDLSSWLEGDDFKAVVNADGANVTKKLNARIDFVRDAIIESAYA